MGFRAGSSVCWPARRRPLPWDFFVRSVLMLPPNLFPIPHLGDGSFVIRRECTAIGPTVRSAREAACVFSAAFAQRVPRERRLVAAGDIVGSHQTRSPRSLLSPGPELG